MKYTECRTFGESIVERAKNTMKADGFLSPILFAFDEQGKVKSVHLQSDRERDIADIAKEVVKREGAYAAVVANEGTFAEMLDGKVYAEYHFDAIAVACVHPDGHAVWITPYAKEHGITLGKTKALEGESFSGPITEILE